MATDKDFTLTFNDTITAASSTIGDLNTINTDVISNQIKRSMYDTITEALYPLSKSSIINQPTREPKSKEQELRDRFKIHEVVTQVVDSVVKAQIAKGGYDSGKSTTKAVVPYSHKDSALSIEVISDAVAKKLDPIFKQLKVAGIINNDSGDLKKELFDQLVSALKENSPKETYTAIKTLGNSLLEVKDAMLGMKSDIDRLIAIRRNGVENSGEVTELVGVMSRIFAGVKGIVTKPGAEGVKAAKSLPTAAKNDIIQVSNKVATIKAEAKAQASGVLKDFKAVPKEMLQAVIDEFIAKVNKVAPSYSDSEFIKVLESFRGKGLDELEAVIRALQNAVDALPKNISVSKESVKDTGNFLTTLRELDNVIRSISLLKDPRSGNTNWNKLSRVSSAVEDTTQRAVIDLEIEHGKALKQLADLSKKSVFIPLIPEVISSPGDIAKQVKDTSGKQVIDVEPKLKNIPSVVDSVPATVRNITPGNPKYSADIKDFSKELGSTVGTLKDLGKHSDTDPLYVAGLNKIIDMLNRVDGGDKKAYEVAGALSIVLEGFIRDSKKFSSTDKLVPVVGAVTDLRDTLFSGTPSVVANQAQHSTATKYDPNFITKSIEYWDKKKSKAMEYWSKKLVQSPIKDGDISSPDVEFSSVGDWTSKVPSEFGGGSLNNPKAIKPKKQKVVEYTTDTADGVLQPRADSTPTKKYDSLQKQAVADSVVDLQKSLLDLQHKIVDEISDGLKGSKSGWGIVREYDTQPVTEYFKRSGGYNQKESGKQYVLNLANIEEMRKRTNLTSAKDRETYSNSQVVDMFKEQQKEKVASQNTTAVQVDELGKWLKNVPLAGIKNWKTLNETQRGFLEGLKIKADKDGGTLPSNEILSAIEGQGQTNVAKLYKETVGEMYAERVLSKDKLVSKLAIPAASAHPTGANIFETANGSQRIIPKYAMYKTGFENMYQTLSKDNKNFKPEERNYAADIKSIGIRPDPADFEKTDKVAENMLKDLAARGSEYRNYIVQQYSKAAVITATRAKKQKRISDTSEITDETSAIQQSLGSGFVKDGGSEAINGFIQAMKGAGVSAYDLLKVWNLWSLVMYTKRLVKCWREMHSFHL